jgi:transposase-like protein
MPQEVLLFVSVTIGIALIMWIINNITLSDTCPRCKSSNDVKRVKRNFFTKFVLFFLRLKKNMCKKCMRTFYRAFAADL